LSFCSMAKNIVKIADWLFRRIDTVYSVTLMTG
jgi:hypothetical protein